MIQQASRINPEEPKWGHPNYKDVIRDKHTFKESLPLPYVTYSDVYGTWLFFQSAPGIKPYFCSCQRKSMFNFLRMNEICPTYILTKEESLLRHFLPEELMQKVEQVKTIDQLESADIFQKGLCHKCNYRVPSVRWSNLQEHSVFIQHFGWYFQQRLLDYGIDWFGTFLVDCCPKHILALIEVDPQNSQKRILEFSRKHNLNFYFFESPLEFYDLRPEFVEIQNLYKVLARSRKRVERIVEAELREYFGFPKRGKTLNNETLLYMILCGLFPDKKVIRHARPKWLNRLTLDVFIPEQFLACEYQGIQHFEPMDHLGGVKEFKVLKERDKLKRDLCFKNQVKLICFDRSDKLTETYVREKIRNQIFRTKASIPG